MIERLKLIIYYQLKTNIHFRPEDAPPPCGDFHDCAQLPDASYPDMSTNCTFFFTCLNGIDYGLQTCNPGK